MSYAEPLDGGVALGFLERYISGNIVPEIGGSVDIAGYRPFTPVNPADVDPGGSESPEAQALFDAYLRRNREKGNFDRPRQRLIEQGFPFGGV